MGTLAGRPLSSLLLRIPIPDVSTDLFLGLPIWHTLHCTRMVGMAPVVLYDVLDHFRFCEQTLSLIIEIPQRESRPPRGTG